MKCRTLICAVLFGVFVFGGANSGPSKEKADPPKKAAEGDEFAKLGKARLEAAQKAYKVYTKDLGSERPFLITTYHLSVHWLNAELDLASGRDERIAAHAAHLQRVKGWKMFFLRDGTEEGTGSIVADSFQREAEYWLQKERSAKK